VPGATFKLLFIKEIFFVMPNFQIITTSLMSLSPLATAWWRLCATAAFLHYLSSPHIPPLRKTSR